MIKVLQRALLFCLFLLCSCYWIKPSNVPIPSISYQEHLKPSTLIILMPGLGDSANIFARQNLVDALHQCNGDLNVVALDSHLGYFSNRTIITRLNTEIIAPAKAQGVDNIWIIGVSLGGLGSLLYSVNHPDDLSGIILLSPYLGEKEDIESLLKSSDLYNWQPEPMNDFQTLWFSLIELSKSENLSNIYMGTGYQDRYIAQQNKFSKLLDESHIIKIQGKHQWSTWNKLWTPLLHKTPLCRPKQKTLNLSMEHKHDETFL